MLTKPYFTPVNLLLSAFLLLLLLPSCGDDNRRARKMPESANAYVYGFTAGTISRIDPIRIRFASQAAEEDQIGKEAPGLISFDPSIAGTAIWEDAQTLRFEPEAPLQSGTVYIATVSLRELFPEVPTEAETFEFDFRTLEQFLQLSVAGLHAPEPENLARQQLKGVLRTADHAEPEPVEQALNARQNGKALPVAWVHNAAGTLHEFTIQQVSRTQQPDELQLNWEGEPLGLELSGEETVEIPALDDFKVMSATTVNGAEQYIQLHFSDPLLESQAFEGLVTISGYSGDILYLPDGNQLRLYPTARINGDRRITVSTGLQNLNGRRMKNPSTWDITIEEAKPAVRLVGSGVILPNSDGLVFPFEAISLKAVEVEVFKIYHNNILQFLQNNKLSGSYSLQEVGRLILQERVDLQQLQPGANSNQWERYALELDRLIGQDPDAIYQVRIGFRQEYATYFCSQPNDEEENNSTDNLQRSGKELESFMDNYYGFAGYYDGYSWDHRNDPCFPAYYNPDNFVRRNVIASNIGIIAKGNEDNQYSAVVTDLRTAEPVSGATLEFYDYQQQLLGTGSTDGEGMARVSLPREPFVVTAKKDEQRGYLRLLDGDALSMSRFDVSGQQAQEGLKGFLYADRGVWRPGDSVYLNFILEDELGKLPPDYPIQLELYDPRGQLQERRSTTNNDHYVYPLPFKTSRDAPTGLWRATVKAGGAVFTKNLRIETVKPNRIAIELDFGQATLNAWSAPHQPRLEARWLHGAPAGGLTAKVEAELRSTDTRFEGYGQYEFDDPARELTTAARTVFNGPLNTGGQATPSFTLTQNQLMPGRLTAHFKTQVFERGGDFSTDNYSLPYDPYQAYVGLRLPTDEGGSKQIEVNDVETIELVALGYDGQPLRNRQLEVGIYRVEWRWWWDQSQDRVSRYNSGEHYGAEKKQSVNTDSQGRARLDFKADDWGRYLIRVCDAEGGHCSGDFLYAGYPWYGDDEDGYRKEAAMLAISSDKTSYQVGETIELQLPEGQAGRMLLSLENGSGIIDQYWVEAKTGKNTITLEATPEMAPTAYAHISLIQPHAQADNDLPIRMYGVLALQVADPATQLQPELKLPETLKPKQNFKVAVSEAEGRPMTYTLAVVDEGLLGLTKFETPAPWDHFYAREALGVKTWDVYDEVLGAYGGQLQRLLGIGGDAAIQPGNAEEANRFDPVVLHLGPFRLEKGRTATHELQMPNYIGAVRVMVVAADEGAYGNAEKRVPVKQPLMVLGTLPRVLSPGETLQLPVNVFAMEDNIRSAEISVSESSGLVELGENRKRLQFSGTGNEIVYFPLEVGNRAGVARFTITASGQGQKASQEIEIAVRNPNPYVSKTSDKTLQPGERHAFSYSLPGMPGTNEAVLEVSSIPPIDLERRLDYLLRYPYGCLEQTLSGGFPQLFAGQLLELDQDQQERAQRNVRATIERLKRFQADGGGLSYWPGHSAPNYWASSFAAHFLLEARQEGYTVPPALLQRLLQFQKEKARSWDPASSGADDYQPGNHGLQQAYRLYTLALAQQPDFAAMNRLREYDGLSVPGKWRLAAAYALSGKPEIARDFTRAAGTEVADYQEMSYTFGSGLRDQAMILETLVLLEQMEEAAQLVRELSEALSAERWLSTQETSFSLLAIAKFAGNSKVGEGLAFRYSEGGQPVNAGSQRPVMQIALNPQQGRAEVENTSKGILFARLIRSGKPAVGGTSAAANQLQVEVSYQTTDGRALQPQSLPQGTDFVAKVRVQHPGKRNRRYQELALEQIFPSGWEIINTRMDNLSAGLNNSPYEYQDIRDDRVHTFFDLRPGETRTYFVQLNAAYEGRFYLPPTACEAMYDQSVNANTAGTWVEVGPPRSM